MEQGFNYVNDSNVALYIYAVQFDEVFEVPIGGSLQLTLSHNDDAPLVVENRLVSDKGRIELRFPKMDESVSLMDHSIIITEDNLNIVVNIIVTKI